jgi:imidazolonepropionase-like amidohydrolase
MTEGGMPPAIALKSATVETAKLLRMEDRLGQIKTGMLADIIALAENPLENIAAVSNVKFVMKDGVVFKNNL